MLQFGSLGFIFQQCHPAFTVFSDRSGRYDAWAGEWTFHPSSKQVLTGLNPSKMPASVQDKGNESEDNFNGIRKGYVPTWAGEEPFSNSGCRGWRCKEPWVCLRLVPALPRPSANLGAHQEAVAGEGRWVLAVAKEGKPDNRGAVCYYRNFLISVKNIDLFY